MGIIKNFKDKFETKSNNEPTSIQNQLQKCINGEQECVHINLNYDETNHSLTHLQLEETKKTVATLSFSLQYDSFHQPIWDVKILNNYGVAPHLIQLPQELSNIPIGAITNGSIKYSLTKEHQSAEEKEFGCTPKPIWRARCIDKETPLYDIAIPDTLNGIRVGDLSRCFEGCKNIRTVSHLPNDALMFRCFANSTIEYGKHIRAMNLEKFGKPTDQVFEGCYNLVEIHGLNSQLILTPEQQKECEDIFDALKNFEQNKLNGMRELLGKYKDVADLLKNYIDNKSEDVQIIVSKETEDNTYYIKAGEKTYCLYPIFENNMIGTLYDIFLYDNEFESKNLTLSENLPEIEQLFSAIEKVSNNTFEQNLTLYGVFNGNDVIFEDDGSICSVQNYIENLAGILNVYREQSGFQTYNLDVDDFYKNYDEDDITPSDICSYISETNGKTPEEFKNTERNQEEL